MSGHKAAGELLDIARMLASEVGDVEEIEPVGSTPVKTRTKEKMGRVHSPGAQMVIQALKSVRTAIGDLRNDMRREGLDREADGMYLDLIRMVEDLEREVKKY